MKKTLSIILVLAMALSMCALSVSAEDVLLIAPAPSAPQGTAITSAAEFAAMDPAGTYYLANDIAISEPYASTFTGTFDGNVNIQITHGISTISIPQEAAGTEIHLICEARDNGEPSLVSYRRVVLTVN